MGVSMNADLLIRDALPADAKPLSQLKLACFRETFLEDFAIPYPPADLAEFESATYGLRQVAGELADPSHKSWVVEGAGGALVGYAHAGPCKLPHQAVASGDGELYQLYLRRGVQGGGLGRRLLDRALQSLAAQGGPIWLGVWSGNARAQAVYAKLGFAIVGEYHFRVGTWLDDERIMRRDPA